MVSNPVFSLHARHRHIYLHDYTSTIGFCATWFIILHSFIRRFFLSISFHIDPVTFHNSSLFSSLPTFSSCQYMVSLTSFIPPTRLVISCDQAACYIYHITLGFFRHLSRLVQLHITPADVLHHFFSPPFQSATFHALGHNDDPPVHAPAIILFVSSAKSRRHIQPTRTLLFMTHRYTSRFVRFG